MKLLAAVTAAVLVPAAASAQPAPAAREVLQTKTGPVHVERLTTLVQPWGMAFLPDGRLLITEKPGRLRIYDAGKLSEPVAGVPSVVFHGQGGLLDVAVDPAFASNGLVYLSYTEAAEVQPPGTQDTPDPRFTSFDKADNIIKGGAVARGRLDGQQLRDVKVIWRQVPKTIGRGHFGGRLLFAPDGKLFITSGDRMRFDPAQDPASNLGKIVRINPDGSNPRDNPFVSKTGGRPDVWSSGHRNPLGAAINPASNQLWINEMGPRHGDELNIAEAGRNYGWPVVSNGDNYDNSRIPDHETRPEFALPAEYWHPAISPSGMIFYTGTRFPDWKGNAFIGGLSSETLLRLVLDGSRVKSEERLALRRRIRDVEQAPDGAVLVLVDGKEGDLLRLTPAPR
jgi:aldose sugar dehydrogenase